MNPLPTGTVKPGRYLTPVWVLAVVVAVRIVLATSTMMALHEMQLRHGISINKLPLWMGWFFVAVMAAEAVVYWVLRHKIYNKRWVIMHLLLMVIALLLIPLLFIIFPWVLRHVFGINSSPKLYHTALQLRFYCFWILFAAGHIFFILTLFKSLDAAPESIEEKIDAIGRE